MEPKVLSKVDWLCLLMLLILVVAGCSPEGQESDLIVPPGWEKYETDELSLCLPEGWMGASREEFNQIITELLADPDFAALAQK